ncbi:MAG: Ig domain-containing protein [Lachnospiraceae bacterium]
MKKMQSRLLCAVLTLAVLATAVFSPVMTTQAASNATLTGSTSVKAGTTASYKIKNLKKGQYAKLTVTGTAAKGVTVKQGTKTIKSSTKITGTGKTITLSVTNKKVVGKRYVLTLKTYSTSTKKKVGSSSTKNVFVYYPASKITLSQDSLSMVEGDEYTLETKKSPSYATSTITWESSDTDVATVEEGVVTAVSAGETDIMATCNGHVAVCTVKVESREPELEDVQVTGARKLTVYYDRNISGIYTASDFSVKKSNAQVKISQVEISGSSAVITVADKLTAGVYSVEAKNQEQYVTAQDETLTTLRTLGSNLAETGKTTTATAEIGYQALNQYGERMDQPGELVVTTTFGKALARRNATEKQDGIIYVYDIPLSKAVWGTTGTIALMDSKAAAASTNQVTYSLAASVKTMTFKGFYNMNTAVMEELVVGDTISDYALVFEAVNQYGVSMDLAALLNESSKLTITASPALTNVTVAGNLLTKENMTTAIIDGQEYPAIKLSGTDSTATAKEGDLRLIIVNSNTGMVANELISVQGSKAVKSMFIEARGTVYAEDRNELDYEIIGTDGKAITKYDILSKLVAFTCAEGSSKLQWERNADGSASLIYIPATTGYKDENNKKTVSRGITMIGNVGSSDTLLQTTSIKVSTARQPEKISGIKGGALACAVGEKLGFATKDLIVLDQYGNRMTEEQTYFPTAKEIYCIVSNKTEKAFVEKKVATLAQNFEYDGTERYEMEAMTKGSGILYLGLKPTMTAETADCAVEISAVDTMEITGITIKSIHDGYPVEVETEAKSSGVTKDMIEVYGSIDDVEFRIPSSQFVITNDTFQTITLADGIVTRTGSIEVSVNTTTGSVVQTAKYQYSNKDRALSSIEAADAENTLSFPDTDSDTLINATDLLRGFKVLDQYGHTRGFDTSGIKYQVSVTEGSVEKITGNNTNDVQITGTKGSTVVLYVAATFGNCTVKQAMQFTYKGRTSNTQKTEQAKSVLTEEFFQTKYATVEQAEQAIWALNQPGITKVEMGTLNKGCAVVKITFIDGTSKDYLFTSIG